MLFVYWRGSNARLLCLEKLRSGLSFKFFRMYFVSDGTLRYQFGYSGRSWIPTLGAQDLLDLFASELGLST